MIAAFDSTIQALSKVNAEWNEFRIRIFLAGSANSFILSKHKNKLLDLKIDSDNCFHSADISLIFFW